MSRASGAAQSNCIIIDSVSDRLKAIDMTVFCVDKNSEVVAFTESKIGPVSILLQPIAITVNDYFTQTSLYNQIKYGATHLTGGGAALALLLAHWTLDQAVQFYGWSSAQPGGVYWLIMA